MKTLLRFEITGMDQKIMIPKGGDILTATIENDVPIIWAMGDYNVELEPKYIEVVSILGFIDNDKRKYIATVQSDDKKLTLHIFEREAANEYF